MEAETKKCDVSIWKLHHRDAEWWAMKCEEKEPFNSLVKQIEGRRWSATYEAWLIPQVKKMHPETRQKLESHYVLTFINNEGQAATEKETPKAMTVQPKAIDKEKPESLADGLPNTNPIKTRSLLSTENQKAIEAFRRELVLKGYSPATQKTYEKEFHIFLKILKGVAAFDFTPERIKDYLYYCATTLKLSEATLHSRMNALKFYYEQVLGREKFFWEVPRPKKPHQNPALFNQDEIAAIIKGTENIKHKAMLMVAYSSGLRVSEVVALKPEDIDSKRMCLHIRQGKGKKDRMVSLSPVLLIMLRAYWEEHKPKPKMYLFEGQEPGTPYSPRSLQLVLQQAKERADVKKKGSIHALRHSFATHLLDKGTDVSLIMKLLGHNDVRTTMRYLHVSNRDLLQIISPLDNLAL